ncbi:hypothetical protein WCLP8_5190003 [uncultured Gammaproteobacteria bacterium]
MLISKSRPAGRLGQQAQVVQPVVRLAPGTATAVSPWAAVREPAQWQCPWPWRCAPGQDFVPATVERVLTGDYPDSITLETLRVGIPLDWGKQAEMFGVG